MRSTPDEAHTAHVPTPAELFCTPAEVRTRLGGSEPWLVKLGLGLVSA